MYNLSGPDWNLFHFVIYMGWALLPCWKFLLCSSPHTVQFSSFSFSFCSVVYSLKICITGRAWDKISSNRTHSKKPGIYCVFKSRQNKYTHPQTTPTVLRSHSLYEGLSVSLKKNYYLSYLLQTLVKTTHVVSRLKDSISHLSSIGLVFWSGSFCVSSEASSRTDKRAAKL